MELEVQFFSESPKGIHYAVNVTPIDIGLHGVDQIREELGLQDFLLSRIDGITSPFLQRDPSIIITEETARASGLFKTTNKIQIAVPPNALNQYVYTKTEAHRGLQTGEVQKAYLKYHIDKNRLIREWENAGFPLKWLFEEKEKE